MSLENASSVRDSIDISFTLHMQNTRTTHYITLHIIDYLIRFIFLQTPGRMSLEDAWSVRDPIDISSTPYIRNTS